MLSHRILNPSNAIRKNLIELSIEFYGKLHLSKERFFGYSDIGGINNKPR